MRNPWLRDSLRESRVVNTRVTVAAAVIGALALLLLIRLAYLQIVTHSYYATLSQENRITPVPIPPARGLIFDRNGVVIAQNFPVYTLEIAPDKVGNLAKLIAQLKDLVALNAKDLRNFRKQLSERRAHENIVLRANLSEEEAARVALNRFRLKGVELTARLQRHYPQGGLAVHALGYVGRISPRDMEHIDKDAYRGMQSIGKVGIEQTYENILLGKVGYENVETDAHGRALRVLNRVPPQAGQNIYLNIDATMQAMAEKAMGNRKGAIVAMDPRTGAVLAFVSTPTYDPNLFVNGIDSDVYKALRDDPDRPLFNRALNGTYSPGSTIKPFYGLAALEMMNLNPTKRVVCPGWFSLPGSRHRFRCWKKEGHGPVDLHDAIVHSCDVYFYRLAVALGPDRIKDFLTRFDFGKKTGIDLDGEATGLVPTPAWKKARGLPPWFPGETVVIGIGQGALSVTPLQLATATSALANGGERVTPRLLNAIEDPATKTVRYLDPPAPVPIGLKDPNHLSMIVKDMVDVVRKGTAANIGINAPYPIAGKTGTAQVKSVAQNQTYNEKKTAERFRDHALFIAFAPADHPRIAIAAIVEHGGHGGSAAAPMVRQMMDYYLLGIDPATAPVKKKAAPRSRAPAPKPAAPVTAPAGPAPDTAQD